MHALSLTVWSVAAALQVVASAGAIRRSPVAAWIFIVSALAMAVGLVSGSFSLLVIASLAAIVAPLCFAMRTGRPVKPAHHFVRLSVLVGLLMLAWWT